MKIVIQPPKMPKDKQLLEMYSYLYQMSQQLNIALNSLSAENIKQSPTPNINNAVAGTKDAAADKYNALKSLIIKTAKDVDDGMETIRNELKGEYVAQSEFGTYKESVSQTISENAAYTRREFEAVYSVTDGLESYQNELRGYIKTGILEEGVLGVEVSHESGEKVRLASGELSFWQGGVKGARMTNNRFYIDNITIGGSAQFGNFIIDTSDGGFALRYIGGNA